ncbi:MAG: TetR/AcrR family transcriptional regulator [Acidimicrobiia bacterium]
MSTSHDHELTRRASPTPRNEGKERMIAAAIELLAERPVERITVRDVAERAGHHHRFVSAWFGGKAGLFLAVLEQQLRDRVPGSTILSTGEIDASTVQLVQVVSWLITNHPELFAGRTETPLIDAMTEFYGERGLPPDDARLYSKLVIAGVAGFVLLEPVLDLRADDLGRLVELQWRMLDALGGEPPGAP